MAYSTKLLSEGEQVLLEFRPHWSALWQETLATIGFITLLILMGPDYNGWAVTILVLLWLWFAVRGFFTWSTTTHVLTSERFIYKSGMVRKVGYEIPLEVINDVAFRQGVFGRMLGVGDLVMETASTNGQSRLNNIPDPEEKKAAVAEARKHRSHDVSRGGEPTSAGSGGSSMSAVEQLEILGRLFDDGKLTQAEYDEQKRRLLS